MSDEQVAQALVNELGFDSGDDGDQGGDMEAFFAEANEESAEAADGPAKFVHEPTGKEFDSEVEFLRYDAGWKNDQWGQRLKELRDELTSLKEKPAEKPETEVQQLTKKQLKEKIWRDQPAEYLDNPVSDFVLEGLDNGLAMYDARIQSVFQQMQAEIAALKGQVQETTLRTQYGVQPDVEQKLVEKHPWLRDIGDPAKRMAAMKDLAGKLGAPETVSPKLVDKIPQRRAADHVEGSAVSTPPDINEFENKLSKLPEREQLSMLGKMFAKSGDFYGWRPEQE